jgi:hypothetical protein
MDSNAHNSLWGSADDSACGDTLVEFLLTHGSFLHNTGNIYIFVDLSKTLDAVTLDG